MARNIFIVDSYLVTGTGTFSHFQGFPKSFDSASYDGDVDTALRRATSAFADQWAAFGTVDDRQVQMVTLTDITGFQIDRKVDGQLVQEEETTEAE